MWACEVGELPTTYLVHPLGALFKSLMVWDMIEERLLSSKGRKLKWIKSTLSSLPIYFVFHFVFLGKVSSDLRRFKEISLLEWSP